MGCHTPYSFKHLLIDCIDLTPKRQNFYTVNNIKELFEHVKVDKILAFLKVVGLYKTVVFKLFLPPAPSPLDQNASTPPLPTNTKTTVMLNVIRIGWFFNHKQFEEYKNNFNKQKWLTFIFQSQTPWTEHEINCKTEQVIINNYPA